MATQSNNQQATHFTLVKQKTPRKHHTMSSTPTFDLDHIIDYSIPPSPTFPPVPRVSLASSISSLHSLYEQDGQRTPPATTYQYTTSHYQYSHQQLYMTGNTTSTLFTDDDLAKAFQDRIHVSPRSSPNRGTLAHDVSDPSSPWKRSIRVRYSDVNMRDSNSMALQEASDLLARDMASYVLPLVLAPISVLWFVFRRGSD